jgi:hypothetical protein
VIGYIIDIINDTSKRGDNEHHVVPIFD